jgi:hypothetical protein
MGEKVCFVLANGDKVSNERADNICGDNYEKSLSTCVFLLSPVQLALLQRLFSR